MLAWSKEAVIQYPLLETFKVVFESGRQHTRYLFAGWEVLGCVLYQYNPGCWWARNILFVFLRDSALFLLTLEML